MSLVKCISIKGGTVCIPREKLVFRPSVYGVIIHDGKMLMIHNKSNGDLFFPGGGVNTGETLADALRREVREETGIEIEAERFLHFQEQFFYWDPGDEAYHMFNFFYTCKAKSTALLDDNQVDDVEAEKPRWIQREDVVRAPNKAIIVGDVLKLLS